MTDQKEYLAEMEISAEIIEAYVGNNPVSADQLTGLITNVFETVVTLANQSVETAPERGEPAVTVKKSLQNDHLVCLEDGKKFKSLKRHLMASHNMTPQQYREKWELKPDYPMVAPAYAEVRSSVAKQTGLGNNRRKK